MGIFPFPRSGSQPTSVSTGTASMGEHSYFILRSVSNVDQPVKKKLDYEVIAAKLLLTCGLEVLIRHWFSALTMQSNEEAQMFNCF